MWHDVDGQLVTTVLARDGFLIRGVWKNHS
jgi:hypothetical protein